MAIEKRKDPDWTNDPRIVSALVSIRPTMRPIEQRLLDQQDCFGLFVIPNEGACTESANCVLAASCKQVYQTSMVEAGRNARPTPPSLLPVPLAPPVVVQATPAYAAQADLARPIRNKWKGRKYKREGYENEGRPVDTFLIAFKDGIGKLPELPLVWHAQNFDEKFGHLGKHVISATASYHTVLRDGVVLTRFWTNTVKTAIVDVLGELVGPLKKASDKLGTYRYRKQELLQLEVPFRIPAESWRKLRPCTHRVIVRTPEAAKVLAQVIRGYWRF